MSKYISFHFSIYKKINILQGWCLSPIAEEFHLENVAFILLLLNSLNRMDIIKDEYNLILTCQLVDVIADCVC